MQKKHGLNAKYNGRKSILEKSNVTQAKMSKLKALCREKKAAKYFEVVCNLISRGGNKS